MRLGLRLTLAFVAVALVVGLVALLYRATSNEVTFRLGTLRQRSITEVVGATGMAMALQSSQVAAQELIAERYRARLEKEPDHDTEWGTAGEIDLDAIHDSLDEFERQHRKVKNAVGTLPAAGGEEERRLLSRLAAIEREFAVHREKMDRFVHLVRYHPSDQVREFVEQELRPHYRDSMLPLIQAFQAGTEAALATEASEIESALRSGDTRNGLLAVVALGVALSLGLFLSRSIVRPLERLTEAAADVGAGDLDREIDLSPGGELGVLSRAFDQMVRDLRSTTVSEARLRASLNEKEVLLREVHHRVKNNLQIVSSLLNLQGRGLADADSARRFRESQNRIRSMAMVHEQLYRSPDLTKIDFREYLEELTRHVVLSFDSAAGASELRLQMSSEPVPIDTAIPCGLIVNELVTNAVEHAFAGDGGTIEVSFERTAAGYRLTVADDGVGLPSGFDPEAGSSLGLKLVVALAEQLNGELRWESNNGARFSIRFPIEASMPEEVVAS